MIKKALFVIILLFFAFQVDAADLGKKLSGRILLDVERNGEAWYVYPENNKRYYLGRPNDAFKIMRELGLGINEINFQKIAQEGMDVDGDLDLANRLSGKIILQTEKNGEAWYINPVNLKKYYLGRPNDAFKIMRELGLGIKIEDLAKVHKPGYDESINQYSKYEHKTISTSFGDFVVDVVEIDLDNPNLKIITSAVKPYPDKALNIGAFGSCELGNFMSESKGFAGINGTYFCSSSGCGAQNYYFYPVYDFSSKELINESELKYWTTGPIMAFDENNNFYYFKDSREFKSIAYFEEKYNIKIRALIGNKPRLIENKMNLLIEWDIDEKQKNTKSLRNAIAYKEPLEINKKGKIFLVIAQNATVPDLAEIMKKMEVDYALNLDGGYSSALWYNDEYMVGPGRNIPNAIIFSE